MINPKYDPNNYLKHLAVAVITDNQKINQLFGSYLLRVRWWHDNPKMSPQFDLIGTLRVHMDTPFGPKEPSDYQFKISSHKQIYVQFLTIPIPEFEYKIEVIHPVGLTRSKIELWEYIPPITYNTSQPSNMQIHQPSNHNNADIIAAIQSGTAAEIAAMQVANQRENLVKSVPTYQASKTWQQIQFVNPDRRSTTISTTGAGITYRFYNYAGAPFDDQNYVAELVGANAQLTRDASEQHTDFFMVCDSENVDGNVDVIVTEMISVPYSSGNLAISNA